MTDELTICSVPYSIFIFILNNSDKVPINYSKSLLFQLRTCGKYSIKLTHYQFICKIDAELNCESCQLQKKEDLKNILVECLF